MQNLTFTSSSSSPSRYTTSLLVPTSNFFPNLNVTRRRNRLNKDFTNFSFFFLKNPPYSRSSFSSCSTTRGRISAGFARGKSRRNHLREKLAGRDVSQVREILKELKKSGFDSKFYSEKNGDGKESSCDVLSGNSDSRNKSETNFDVRENGDEKEGNVELGTLDFKKNTGIEKEVTDKLDSDYELEKSDVHVPKESALWDKLDSWIECYKRDNEVWGVGTGPIFVIYEDSNGNVSKVDVNEDEIVKRSRIEAWSVGEERGEEELDVRSRISRAKVIAKEIMSNKFKLPRSSSIAKYVVEGEKTSHVDRLGATVDRVKTLTKFSPKIGATIFLGYFVFWVISKLSIRGGGIEPTSEEKEMLRRKLIARKENRINSSMVKGSVEVLETAVEFPKELANRPELDKDELRKALLKANKSNKPSAMLRSSDTSPEDHIFEEKVRKIRDMAREVRESEKEMSRRNNASVKEKKLQTGIDSVQPDINNVILNSRLNLDDVKEKKLQTGIDSVQPDINNVILNSPLNVNEDGKEKKLQTEIDSVQPDMNNVILNSPLNVNEDGKEKKLQTEIDSVQPDINNLILNSPLNVSEDRLNPIVDEGVNMHSEHSDKKESSNAYLDSSSLLTKSSSVIKPTIIRSVKEAREYLGKKHGQPFQESNSHQSASNSFNGKKDYMIERDVNALECDTGEKKNATSPADASDKTFSVDKDMDNENENTSVRSTNAYASNERKFHFPSDGLLRANTIAPKDTSCEGVQYMDNAMENIELKSPESHAIGDDLWTANAVAPNNRSQEIKNEISRSQSQDYFLKRSQQNKEMKKGNSSEVEMGRTKSHPVNAKSIKDKEKGGTDKEVMMPPVNVAGKDVVPVPALPTHTVESSSIKNNIDNLKIDLDSVDMSKDLKFHAMTNSTISDNNGSKREDDNVIVQKCDIDSSCQSSETEHSPDPQTSDRKKWIEENFQNFDPVIKKIGVGFKENYMVAKENKEEQNLVNVDISELGLTGDDDELEWMNDDKLRHIVLQVRDNELAGHDPFHMMNVEEQSIFFEGLEKKADKMNSKLQGLHEWIHSRIENIDYGADGISLYDSPEKIIPRWKGPPIDKLPTKKGFSEGITNYSVESNGIGGKLQISEEQLCTGGDSTYSVHNLTKMQDGMPAKPKIVIESSDGSIKAGKKGRKEQWEHTKKWSRDFLELYNAETDPELKSVMKDMGKDLDKWITPTEIQETADLMTKIPKKKREFIEKKINKLKREIETFGQQAVVSKYKEYSEDKEEDYLWWLDLKFVLCIELYTLENDIQKVGFYSLEMAEDLELNPKQYHVIAFQNTGDAKNFCYIMQAHLEMLGTGSAFVVARPPKDAFREAKANGFHVTVIRKGEMKLNIDQTLEEVEEKLLEIGSKMYHDKIMRERSVDMGTLMKGVFASDKSKKRRIPRTLAKNIHSSNFKQSNVDRK